MQITGSASIISWNARTTGWNGAAFSSASWIVSCNHRSRSLGSFGSQPPSLLVSDTAAGRSKTIGAPPEPSQIGLHRLPVWPMLTTRESIDGCQPRLRADSLTNVNCESRSSGEGRAADGLESADVLANVLPHLEPGVRTRISLPHRRCLRLG